MKFLYILLLWIVVASVYTAQSPYRKMYALLKRGLPMTAQTFEKTPPPHEKARYHYMVEGTTYTGEDEIKNDADRYAADYEMRGLYLPEDPSFSWVRVDTLKESAEHARNTVVAFDLLAAPAIACIAVFGATQLWELLRRREEE